MSRALCIGLTGGIGSGKSTATDLFVSLGVPCIDADDVSRQVVERGSDAIQEISSTFGQDVLDKQGNLDRKKMRQIVFDDSKAREKLESIVHPRVYARINDFIKSVSYPYCIISSPLLIEKRNNYTHDRVLVIDVPESLQLTRASERDSQGEEEIAKIIQSQVPRTERLEAADDIISNDGDMENLRAQVNALHQGYLELAAERG